MSQDSIKKSGCLEKLPVKGLVKKWSRRWFVLYGTSHEGVVRIEYFDSRETFRNGVGKRTIPMREGRSLSTAAANKLHPYVFQFTSQIGHHVLAADSQPELEEWMECIKNAIQDDRLRRRRTKGQSMVVASDDTDHLPSFSDDTGMSYKNRIDSGTYRVTVEENETSIKMALSGTYSLELYPTMLSLVAPSGAKIFSLPYRHLKNYGKQSGKFHFETGKNSPIGIGKLLLVTSCSKEVFGVVHNNIKKMREDTPDQQGPKPVPPQKPDKYQPTQAVSHPQPVQSVEQPPLPKKKISTTTRPVSEALDSSVAGTYRLSTDLEEASAAASTSPLYSTVDMSKKKNSKQQQQKENDPVKQPYGSVIEEPTATASDDAHIYSDPYEEDPAYRVPNHQSSAAGVDNLRASVGLVEMEDNVFGDSFDDDDDDEEPLAEGASNPLNDSNMVDFDGDVRPHHKLSVMSAESIAADLATLDFGFGPGNLGPPEDGAGAGGNLDNPENMDFNFDFGGDVGLPPSSGDPFSSNLGAAGTGDLADFDLGKLDANFFEKLDAIDQQPSW